MDDSRYHDLAYRIWENDAVYRAQVEEIRKVTRQRVANKYILNDKMMDAAPSTRGQALIQMFASFPEVLPRVMIPPIVTREREDIQATNIERFIRGIRRATKYGDIHPDDAFWLHYGEAGRGILYTAFDVECAARGEFPFVRQAVDPLTFSFKASARGLMYAVRNTQRDALELYDELAGTYEKVKHNKPEWTIPTSLQDAYDNGSAVTVDVMQLWDREREYMWIGGECVWKFKGAEGRPHLMGRVPFDIGFCMQMPGDRPEELGWGIIKPVLENLKNEANMMTKAYNGFNYFFMPLIALQDISGRVFFEQFVPGAGYDNINKYDIANPQVSAQMMEQLLAHNNDAINRASLSETTFGDSGRQLSGFAYSQVNAGPQRRNERLLDSGTDAYKNHYNLILSRIAEYANAESAKEFGVKDEKAYLDAFATFTPVKTNPNKELRIKVVLSSKDVSEYQIVEVDFKPEPTEDANAKYQRAQIAKGFMPQEWIDREVLKVDAPEQVQQWRKEEMLMQDAQWAQRMMDVWKKQKLESDKDLRLEFQQQDLAQLPPEIQQMVEEMVRSGASFDEAMDAVAQFVPPEPAPPAPDAMMQQGMMPSMGQPPMGQPPMMMPQQGMMPPQQPPMMMPQQPNMLEQLIASLPPEIQQLLQDPTIRQAFLEMLQQGIPPEQAIQQLMQMLQAQQQQAPSAAFVSPAQMGQSPLPPNQAAAMQGF